MSGSKRKLPKLGLLLLCINVCSCENTTTTVEESTEHPQIELLNRWRTNNTAAAKAKVKLTGIPQIDYATDPNLPHELHGYDLSDYPFYNRVPNVNFNFSCDDRHDGFYASIPHKCQVYHNCLFGVRYDFLCANYTAFDQSNFICSWVNIVDCENSERYYDRNNELYVEATTTTTTTAAPVVQIVYVDRETGNVRDRPTNRGPSRKKSTPKPQVEEYYYDDYVDEAIPQQGNKKQNLKENVYDDALYYDDVTEKATTTTQATTTKRQLVNRRPSRPQRTRTGESQSANNKQTSTQVQRTKVRPQINSQIPDYDVEGVNTGERQPQRTQQDGQRGKPQRRRQKKTTTTSTTTPAPEYYDDYYDYYETENSPSTAAPKKKPFPGARPTAEDRRKALLTSRVSHLVPKNIAPTNSDVVEPEEPVVEEPPLNARPSAKVRTQSPAPQPAADSVNSPSYDDYEYEVIPPVAKQPVEEPATLNSRRRGSAQSRRSPSQIDRARTRRGLIDK